MTIELWFSTHNYIKSCCETKPLSFSLFCTLVVTVTVMRQVIKIEKEITVASDVKNFCCIRNYHHVSLGTHSLHVIDLTSQK